MANIRQMRIANINSLKYVLDILMDYFESDDAKALSSHNYDWYSLAKYIYLGCRRQDPWIDDVFLALNKVQFQDDLSFEEWWQQTRLVNKLTFARGLVTYLRWHLGDNITTDSIFECIRDDYSEIFDKNYHHRDIFMHANYDDVRLYADFDHFEGDFAFAKILDAVNPEDGAFDDHIDYYLNQNDNMVVALHPYRTALMDVSPEYLMSQVESKCFIFKIPLVEMSYSDHSDYSDDAVMFNFEIRPSLSLYENYLPKEFKQNVDNSRY